MPPDTPSPSVLLIVRDFPPYHYSLGGVNRILKLAEFLVGQGLHVFVVAAKGVPLTTFGYDSLLKRLHVHYVEDPYQRYVTRKHLPRPAASGSRANSGGWSGSWMRRLISNLATPDLGVFFQGGLVRASLDIIRLHQISNVIVSSPLHSTQLIGLRLKRHLGDAINLIVDYRDSWNGSSLFRKPFVLLQRLNEAFEAAVLRNADRLLYVSPPMRDKLERKYKRLPNEMLLVMNGFDEGMLAQLSRPRQPVDHGGGDLTIGHFGPLSADLFGYRNPEALFGVVAKHDLPVKIVQYGECAVPSSLTNQIMGKLDIRSAVSHVQALRAMQSMDVLLLYHTCKQDSDEVVSGKLFDYMLAERPILVLGPSDMEAAKLVERHGLGYVADLFDPDCVRNVVLRIAADKREGRFPAYKASDLREYSRQAQFSKILPLLRRGGTPSQRLA